MEIAVSKNLVQADTTAFAVLDPVESLADPRLEPLLAADRGVRRSGRDRSSPHRTTGE